MIIMQDANEKTQYPEPVGDKLRLELSFTFPLEHVTEVIVLGDRMFWAAVNKFGIVEKSI